jgi:D-apionolactonase
MKTIQLPFDVTLAPITHLKAGAITCIYEEGKLRYIKKGKSEILRMIYVAVRDKNWTTVPYKMEAEKIEVTGENFLISYTAFHELGEIDYKSFVEIKREKDGTISFSFKGEALSSFQRNRIGLCVLHPMKECAGNAATIISPGGSSYEGLFPKQVSPHQPFKNIQQLKWKINDQVKAELFFEGDIFETEDQRNWSDNSYKTYSTPLEIPYPVLVKKGDTVEQKLILKVSDEEPEQNSFPTISEENKIPFPKIGYARSQEPLTNVEIDLLKKIPFDHYRVTLRLSEEDWQEGLLLTVEEAKKLAAKIELVVFFNKNSEEEINQLSEALQPFKTIIQSLLVLREGEKISSPGLLRNAYAILKKALGDIKIGYGTDVNFVEVNRNRPGNIQYDFVSFGLNPQLHANDTRTIIENLEAQKDLLDTAQQFSEGREIYVSPITLNNKDDSSNDRLHTSFGAIWTLNTLRNLSGAQSLTLYETKGRNGLLKKDINQQNVFTETEVYKLLCEIKSFNPKWIITNNDERKQFIVENEYGERLAINHPDLNDLIGLG